MGAFRARSHPGAVGCQKRKRAVLLVISFTPGQGINLPPSAHKDMRELNYVCVCVCVLVYMVSMHTHAHTHAPGEHLFFKAYAG